MARGLSSKRMNKKGSRDKLITICIRLVLILIVVWLVWSQNNLVTVYDTTFSVPKLPKSLVGTRIVHISDIANSTVGLVAKVQKQEPDIIVMSGGYYDTNGNCDNTVSIVQQLVQIAPVYYVTNIHDRGNDPLQGTGATNIDGDFVILDGKQWQSTDDFLISVYGKYGNIIVDKANAVNNGTNDSEEYLAAARYYDYVSKKLQESAGAKIRITGISDMDGENPGKAARKKIDSMTELSQADYEIVLVGNMTLANEIAKSNMIDAIFTGGTFGVGFTDGELDYFQGDYGVGLEKGNFGYHGTQLFVSGGIGTYPGKHRIFNFPEFQCIVLSDGTIKDHNPLENLIAKFFDDVGTIYDNDGGFTEGQVAVSKD